MIKSRRLIWAGHVAKMEEGRSAFNILRRTPTRNRHLERSRRIWEDNIRKDLKEIGINARDWVDSAQDSDYWRFSVNKCGIEPSDSISHGVSHKNTNMLNCSTFSISMEMFV